MTHLHQHLKPDFMEQHSLANLHRAGMATDERYLGDMTPTEVLIIPPAQGHKGSDSNYFSSLQWDHCGVPLHPGTWPAELKQQLFTQA